MKLLVTGGYGFIGSAVVRTAISRGHRVINLDALTYAANRANLASVETSNAYTFVHADLVDREAVNQVFADHAPDAVIHLAAETHVDRSIDEPGVFIETNVEGTANLLAAARRFLADGNAARAERFRVLHVSTDEVYGSLEPEDSGFTEDNAYRPNSPYAASKASADMMVRAWNKTYGLPTLISNCSNNYGPFQNPEKLIPTVTLNALRGRAIPVYGDGSNVRDWLHVDDHADALFTILERGRLGETYNVGGNAERSNIELVRAICREMDALLPDRAPHERLIEFVTDRPGHDFRYAINASKLHGELGWSPSASLESGLAQTVRWYLENEVWVEASLARLPDEQRLARRGLATP
ncbi:dTDP-glucose 4,6-dehydratase [Maricaulis sp.]|uniref:dTDP-glucose 4,6-dehydratase n=1 Tax=Maricaulis sp. TaxID=1486257 RepID=UPI00261E8E04|nr:dTDP-glucose 4,6-dehydratase [Maricaulis sp.]